MTDLKLSPTMLSYLRTVRQYTEGSGDPYTSWTTDSRRTQPALLKRGLIAPNPHPRRRRDRQAVRLTEAGREALAAHEGRETRVVTCRRAWGRRTGYKVVWAPTEGHHVPR